MRYSLTALLAFAGATPALAASGPFFSLANTDFVVLLGLLLFIAVLFYFKVPGMIGGALDKRADGIKSELDEARSIREEAQTLLASYERKQKEVQEQADRIVAKAKADAAAAGEQAKEDIAQSITRRLAAAQEQIESAQTSAIKEVRDQAALVAVAVSRDVIAKQMTAASSNDLIDEAISVVDSKLH